MTTKEMLEERAKLDKQIRDIVDKAEKENRNLNAEEKKTFDELHTKDMELKERIDRQAALAKREKELADIQDNGIDRRKTPASAAGKPPRENKEKITDEEVMLAIGAWACRQSGLPLDKRQKAAAIKYREQVDQRFSVSRKNLDLRLSSDREFHALQRKFRGTHPERRDMSTTTGADWIPTGFINRLEIAQLTYGPMWQTSEVLTTDSGNPLTWPTANDTGNEGAQVDEATSDGGTSTDPIMGSITLGAFKFTSKLVKVSTEIIEDSAFDVPGNLGDMLGERLGRITNKRFTTGTGSGQPHGIVPASMLGVTTALANAIAPDELIDLQQSVDPAYRPGAGWMMHDSTLGGIRKLKDLQGNYIFQPGLQLGVPDRLLGAVININQQMEGLDDVGDSTDATEILILYGQLTKYKIRRVRGIRLRRLVERFAETDQEGFVAFLRCDGELLDAGTHPVKHLKMFG